MSKTKASTKLLPFDAARYLPDDAAVTEYMTAILETDDPDLLLLALGDVARACMASLSARSRALIPC
jgi:probable addiction module antidote protein